MTSLKDIKRKRNNVVKDEKQILLESYIEQYKYYFENKTLQKIYQEANKGDKFIIHG